MREVGAVCGARKGVCSGFKRGFCVVTDPLGKRQRKPVP